MVNLPRFSIAAKLYAIFALLATVTVALALLAAVNANRHAAMTGEFEAASRGAQLVERLNGQIYAARLELRGIFLSADDVSARNFTTSLMNHHENISYVVAEWRMVVRPEDVAPFEALDDRVNAYRAFLREAVAHANDFGLKITHSVADVETENKLRAALNKDLEAFGELYARRARRSFSEINERIS